MKINFIIFWTIGSLLSSCKNSENSVSDSQDAVIIYDTETLAFLKNEEILKHLELQVNVPNEEFDPDVPYELTSKDFRLASDVISAYLLKNAFTMNNQSLKIIKDIFGSCNVKKLEDNIYVVMPNPHFKHKPFDLFFYTEHYFYDAQNGLFTRMHTLEELLPYPIVNPQYSPKQIEEAKTLVVNLNLYLLNKNNSVLPFLLEHDPFFMENLVLKFGWEGDDDLLRWVIKRVNDEYFSGNYNSGSAYAKLIFNRVCTSGVNINKRVLELLGEDIETHEYALNQVIQSLNKDNDSDYLSFSEDAKIKGHVLDLLYRKLNSEGWGVSASYFFDDAIYEKYNKEFTKNNYYGLNDLKEIWELIWQLY